MIKYCLILFLLLFAQTWSSPSVLLTSDRHVTAWNFVNYRFRLTNTSSSPILNPEINYYAAPAQLDAHVDFSSGLNPVTTSVEQANQYTVVKFSLHGLLFPGDSVEIQCRIYSVGYLMEWNSSNDWSYQKNTEVYEPNHYMTVYDASHNILWGYDPLSGNQNASDVVLWTDRGGNYTVERYDGDEAEVVPAGRFWMLKDSPVSPKERDLLAERGIVKYSGGVRQGKTLALFRSEGDVPKYLLDSLVAGFYNTVSVDDSTPIQIEYYQDSLYEDSTRIDMDIFCWPDVSVDGCVDEIAACGGDDIGVARGFLIARVRKDSLQCLAHSRNIDGLAVQHEAAPTISAVDRDAVNISKLQNSAAWQAALQMDRATKEWLSGVGYTGEGIVVGVYDDGIDFRHPDFNEYDSTENMVDRRMRSGEYYGNNFEGIDESKIMISSYHGNLVGGIIGGNGNNSVLFRYRGIAPKVHFYTGFNYMESYANVGHVANHSHVTSKSSFYSVGDAIMDNAIFFNWKSECTKRYPDDEAYTENCVEGDTLVKTVVFGAGNNGDGNSIYGIHRGYHSILANSKNAITVGNMTSVEKVRFHHSSMGPTWDGRIKPDIMAPGATKQMIVNADQPAKIAVDYIKFYRKNSSTPYFTIDFVDNNYEIDTNNINCDTGWETFNGKPILTCLVTESYRLGVWIGLKMNAAPKIDSTDEMEIMVRKAYGWSEDSLIYGNIFFGKNETGFYNPQNKNDTTWFCSMPIVWNAKNTFTPTKISLNGIGDSLNAYYMRLDFSFIYGLISPAVCKSDSCGYNYLTDGGTSGSAPFISGIAALMYQKFRDTTGDSLHKHSMRNSTVKALMIHTAVDMEDSPLAHFASNPDLDKAHHDGMPHYTPYGKGPDFATGWGYVDGKAALDMISDYNKNTKEFAKFREIEIGNGVEKRWTTVVSSGRNHLRATLVWDDFPGLAHKDSDSWMSIKEPKLVNDLDMYLVSPSGQYFYPWRLDTLPTGFIDENGKSSYTPTGFENIHESDVHDAYNGCSVGNLVGTECFDHRNNVEVVDVDNPEPGVWQIVVLGRNVSEFNNADSNAQVATLVSDSALSANEHCSVVHNYAPQTDYRCTYALGKDAISYVTFDEKTYVGAGDDIQLFDENGNLLGTYVENQLAGKRLKLKSKRLTVVLHSDNDSSQGWGFDITKIKVYPISVLKMPFEFTKNAGGNP